MAVHEDGEGFEVIEAKLVAGDGGEGVGIEGDALGVAKEEHGVGERRVEVTGTEEFEEDVVERSEKGSRGMLKMEIREAGRGEGEEKRGCLGVLLVCVFKFLLRFFH